MSEQTPFNSEYEKTASLVLEVAKNAGRIILENGGETYRAEETCTRICTHFGGKNIAVLAITTGIVLSAEFFDKEITTVARIDTRGINLINVAQVNDISRRLENSSITLNQANDLLNEILSGDKPARFRRLKAFAVAAVGTGFSSAFFSILFGGSAPEFFVALMTGVVVAGLNTFFSSKKANGFITSLVLGVVAALIAISASFLFTDFRYDLVIIGSIMPLLPGIAMTVAFRDSIRGDLISGVSRILEAIVLAIAIASGVGIVIGTFLHFNLIGGFLV